MVSICIPYVRPDNIERLILLIHANAGIKDYEILTEEDTERIGCPKMLARLIERSEGDLVCFLGDDTEPMPGFLKLGLHAMKSLPDGWGLVGFNDRTGRTLPTHWIADKRLLPEINGEFFYTGYTHCFCDRELMERAISIGRYAYAWQAVVLHHHPLISGTNGEWDEDYQRVYSYDVFEQDKKLYEERRQLWS